MTYKTGEIVRLINESVVVVVDGGDTRRTVVMPLQGELPVNSTVHRLAGGWVIVSDAIKCRIRATYEEEPEPKPITALRARLLVGRAAVEFGAAVTATRIGPEKYELGILVTKKDEPRTRYFTDADDVGRFLNSL